MVTDRRWLFVLFGVLVALFAALPASDCGNPALAADPAPAVLPPGVHPVTNGLACAHCHESPHADTAKAPCATCHTPKSWVPTFDVTAHASTAFPLKGKHAAVECKVCHTDHKLTGMPTECSGCHVDRHRGKLGLDCTQCHSEEGFKPVANFDHAKTGFVLTGKHGTLQCASCHEGELGKVMRHTETVTCQTCHISDHADYEGRDCATCHDPAGGHSFAEARLAMTFDHRDTGFPLERRHAATDCKDCHPVGSGHPMNACASCHTDVHGGQLGMQCDDCHRPDRWRLARFDHDLTGFVLRGKHFVISCDSCHQNQQWIGLGTECYECHSSDAGRALGSHPEVAAHHFGERTCGDCHNTWNWNP